MAAWRARLDPATIELQKAVWGFSDLDCVPARLFSVSTHIGGLVLGALDGDRMVGFSLALPAVKPGGCAYWHSHMTGVLPSYQGRKVGRALKLEQLRQALQAGIRLIEWTFDPLEIRNSYFNIERLGVVVRRFMPNQYGITSSHLHGALPTDRLVAEWYVASPRVNAVIDAGRPADKLVEETIEVPAAIGELRRANATVAREIQSRIRERFQQGLARGLAVIGYRRTNQGGVFELGRLDPSQTPGA
jgi:predicted GNAT superfamily acetyltransferase